MIFSKLYSKYERWKRMRWFNKVFKKYATFMPGKKNLKTETNSTVYNKLLKLLFHCRYCAANKGHNNRRCNPHRTQKEKRFQSLKNTDEKTYKEKLPPLSDKYGLSDKLQWTEIPEYPEIPEENKP